MTQITSVEVLPQSRSSADSAVLQQATATLFDELTPDVMQEVLRYALTERKTFTTLNTMTFAGAKQQRHQSIFEQKLPPNAYRTHYPQRVFKDYILSSEVFCLGRRPGAPVSAPASKP